MTAFRVATLFRFFMSRLDAERFLPAVVAAKPELSSKAICAVQVRLLTALRNIAAYETPGHADSFVLHSPNSDGLVPGFDAAGNVVGIDIDHALEKLDLKTLETTSFPAGTTKTTL